MARSSESPRRKPTTGSGDRWSTIDAKAALRGFFGVTKAWGLDRAQERILLGSPPRSTFQTMVNGSKSRLSRDELERISYVLGIYKSLRLLLTNIERAHGWMREPNKRFGGRSALEHIVEGGSVADLAEVRRYLDAIRGGV